MKKAFTITEALLTLSIMGLIMLMSISLVGNGFRERQNRAKKQAFAADISQAARKYALKNGSLKNIGSASSVVSAFGLTTCSGACFKTGTSYSSINSASKFAMPTTQNSLAGFTNTGAFADAYTKNDVYVRIAYNSNCTTTDNSFATDGLSKTDVCINMIFDVNGMKGPNKQGDDIGFLTIFRPQNPLVISPITTKTKSACDRAKNGLESLPSKKEAMAIYINNKIVNNTLTSLSSIKTMNDATGITTSPTGSICVQR